MEKAYFEFMGLNIKPVIRILIRVDWILIDFGQLDPDPNWECGSGSTKIDNSDEVSSFAVLDVIF